MATTTAVKTILGSCVGSGESGDAHNASGYPAPTVEYMDRVGRELEKLVERLLGSSEADDPVRHRALRDELDRTAWAFAEGVAWARVLGAPDPDCLDISAFTTEERLVLDLGFLCGGLCRDSASDLERAVMADGEVKLLHDLIPDMAAKVFRARELHEKRERSDHLEEQIRKQQALSEEAAREHAALLAALAENERVKEIQVGIEELLPALAALGGPAPRPRAVEAHRQHQKLMNGWNRLLRRQEELIDTYADRRVVKESQNHRLSLLAAQRGFELELEEHREDLAETVRETESLSGEDVRGLIGAEFERIRQVLRAAGKLGARAVPRFVLDGQTNWLPTHVEAALRESLEIDRRMSQAWAQGTWPKPRLVVLPGCGSAVYDSARQTIWIPVASRDKTFCSLRRSLGLYHFGQARGEHKSFRRLEPFQRMSDTTELGNAFAWAYEIYLMREAKGFRKLPTDVRKWFKLHFMQQT